VERSICPIAMLYSLATAYKGGGCKQGAIIFHGGRVAVNYRPKIRCHGNKGRQRRNLNGTIGQHGPENRG